MGTRTTLAFGLEAMYIILRQKKMYSETLQETEIKGTRLTDLVEEISRQANIRAVEPYCWLLSARFTLRIGSSTAEPKTKKFAAWPERKSCKV